MKCDYCETGKMSKFSGYEYRGRFLKNISGRRCDNCGELSFDSKVYETFEEIDRKLDGLLAPEEIKTRRKKLNLTQEEVANELNIPRLTYLRWENGQVIQTPQNNMNLEKLFMRHEELEAQTKEVDNYLKVVYSGDMSTYKNYDGYALAAHHEGELHKAQSQKIREILKKKRNEGNK